MVVIFNKFPVIREEGFNWDLPQILKVTDFCNSLSLALTRNLGWVINIFFSRERD